MSALREIVAAFTVAVDSAPLKEGERNVDGFLKKLKDAGTAIATVFAVDKLKGFIDGQLEVAGTLRRSAVLIGTSTQQLQEYGLAAQLAGVDQESMTTGLRFLNRNLAEAAHGSTEIQKQFASVGIAFKDSAGHTRAAGDVLGELADKVAGIQSPAERTELAMKLLGRGGAELIPLLAKGSAAFAEAAVEVKKLGGGMDDTFLAKAKAASHAQHELDFAMVGLKAEIAGELLPAFAEIVTTVTNWVVAVREATRGTNVFKDALEVFGVIAGVKTAQVLVGLVRSLAAVTAGAAQAAAAFIADWGAMLLPVIAVGAAVDILYYALTGKSLHGVIWDWLFGGDGADGAKEVGSIVDKLGALSGGKLPGSPGSKGDDATKALGGAVGDNTRAVRDTVRALHETTDALHSATEAFMAQAGFPVAFDRGAGARIEGIHVLRNHPVDPGPLGHAITPEAQKLHEKRVAEGRGAPGPATYLPPSGRLPSPGGGGPRAPGNVIIHNKTNIHQNIPRGDPKAAGKAAGDATATAQQRAAADAYAAWYGK